MKSNIKYDKNIVPSFQQIKYSRGNDFTTRNTELLEAEELKTRDQSDVSKVLIKNINCQEKWVFMVLKRIYSKNLREAFSNEVGAYITNSDLINLVANPILLITSYAQLIRGNEDITISAHQMSDEELLREIKRGVHGLTMDMFIETCILIKQGRYSWGTNKQVYIGKTLVVIPTFMDKVVQSAIREVLISVYEPVFDRMNCSFGFRPNRSVQDAIYALTNSASNGLFMVLEGCIKAEFNKLNSRKLLETLRKSLKDEKFINLIKSYVEYIYYKLEKKPYVIEKDGILQEGGTVLRYLWNIYLLELDIYIWKEVKERVEETNNKLRRISSEDRRFLNNQRLKHYRLKISINKILEWFRKEKTLTVEENINLLKSTHIKDWKKIDSIFKGSLKVGILTFIKSNMTTNKELTFKILEKKKNKLVHEMTNMPYYDVNKIRLRFVYSRYAGYWLILGNFKQEFIKDIKIKIAKFLKDELYVTLSEEKNFITNLEKKPVCFLGFKILIDKTRNLKVNILGNRVVVGVDRHQMLRSLYLNGYCDVRGFPRETSHLNKLETFTIINRANNVLIRLCNYYMIAVRDLRVELSRWVYIIRYSCLKTIAQKYKVTVKKIISKFRVLKQSEKGEKTIEDTVTLNLGGVCYKKTWKLFTLNELLDHCKGEKGQEQKGMIPNRYWKLQKCIPFEDKKKQEKFKYDNMYLSERVNFANIFASSNFHCICSICGCAKKYCGRYGTKTWGELLVLRNREQILVCFDCYKSIISISRYNRRPQNTLLEKGWEIVEETESYPCKRGELAN